MPALALSFLSGVLLLQCFSFLPAQQWVVGLVIVSVFIYLLENRFKFIFIAILFGFSWSLLVANKIKCDFSILPPTIQGHIISIPQKINDQVSFLFEVDKPVSTKVRLSWRHPSCSLIAGDQWELPVKLKKIHYAEAWAFQNGITAQGYVIAQNHPVFISHKNVINRLRQYIQLEVEKVLPHSQTSPWIIALMIGERAGIPQSEWEVLRNTGTNHLMAIAGLHIGFLSSISYVSVVAIWRLVPRLMLIIPAYQAGACASLIMAFFYSTLAGFSIPTQRACIMISVFLMSTLYRRIIPPWQAFGLALLLVLMINPLSVLSSSFWLSFTTIALIIYGMGGRIKPHGLWWKWGRVQWVIAIGLFPLSLWFFTQYSLVSFIANSIAIPWVGFLILPLCFISVILILFNSILAKWTLLLADKSLSILWSILTWFSHLPFASWHQTIPHPIFLIIAVIGIVILLSPAGFPGKCSGFFWLLPVLLFKPILPLKGEVNFSLLDVGQGLSVVIQTKHHALVYDTGVIGERVLDYLQSRNIQKLDMLVISHGDKDHSGGAAVILEKLPVKIIFTSVPALFYSAQYCLAGEKWEWDGVQFEFLYPTPSTLNQGNNSSCVLKISTEKQHILLTGDIEKEAEKFLIASTPEKLSADILVAPHHGSKTSGLREFIEDVHPQYVLYATGYQNRYHFPHASVVETYRTIGAIQYETATAGDIQFKVNKDASLLLSLSRANHHFWNVLPG